MAQQAEAGCKPWYEDLPLDFGRTDTRSAENLLIGAYPSNEDALRLAEDAGLKRTSLKQPARLSDQIREIMQAARTANRMSHLVRQVLSDPQKEAVRSDLRVLVGGSDSTLLRTLLDDPNLGAQYNELRRLFDGKDSYALPVSASTSHSSIVEHDFSMDVYDLYRPGLRDLKHLDGLRLSPRWHLKELSDLREALLNYPPNPSQGILLSGLCDVVTALYHAREAKQLLDTMGVSEIKLGRLQALYFQEIGRYPKKDVLSRDALLVEAAAAGIRARRDGSQAELSPLACLLVAFMAESGENIDQSGIRVWLKTFGHQFADAASHYAHCANRTAWLFIDLGGEPDEDSPLVLKGAYALLLTEAATETLRPIAGPDDITDAELLQWLRRTIHAAREAVGSTDLVVDIAAPCEILARGIEHVPMVEVYKHMEPLARRYGPRLRWSQRRLVPELQERSRACQDGLAWAQAPAVLSNNLGDDSAAISDWLAQGSRNWLLCSQSADQLTELLKRVLYEGAPYVVWYQNGLTESEVEGVINATESVSAAARKDELPNHIPRMIANGGPSVIWDDREGRGRFQLASISHFQGPEG